MDDEILQEPQLYLSFREYPGQPGRNYDIGQEGESLITFDQ